MKSKAITAFLRFFIFIILLSICLVSCTQEKQPPHFPSNRGDDNAIAVGGKPSTRETTKSDENYNNNLSSGKKKVALTFDDGPHNVHTKAIVDELKKYNYRATFFVVGNRVDGSEYNGASAAKYVVQNNHELAIHGYTHNYYYNKCSDSIYSSELSKTATAIKGAGYSKAIKLMRPIGGSITTKRVESCKYSVILWDVDSEDWKYKYSSSDTSVQRQEKLDTIVNNVMNQVSDGSIILMHDIYESTYDATVIILKKLHDAGYEVVTVSDLLGSSAQAGVKYSRKPK